MSLQKKGKIIERLLNVVHFEIKQPVHYGEAIYIEFLNLQDKRQPLRMECEDEEYWFYRKKISPSQCLDENLQYQYFIADYFNPESNRSEIKFKYDTSFPKKYIPYNFTVVHDKPWMDDYDRLDVTPEKNLIYFSLEYLKAINYGEAIYVMWFSPNEGERLSFTEEDIKRSQRLVWNPGHSWQGTVVIKKEFFIQNNGQLLFPFVKSFYSKRMLSEFQSILQDQNGNKKTLNIQEDKDITERAVFEGKDSNIRIELNDLDNVDQAKYVEIEGFGQFELMHDDETGKHYVEFLADREFFENDQNTLKISLSNQKPVVVTVQEPQQGHVSQISLTAQKSQIQIAESSTILKPQLQENVHMPEYLNKYSTIYNRQSYSNNGSQSTLYNGNQNQSNSNHGRVSTSANQNSDYNGNQNQSNSNQGRESTSANQNSDSENYGQQNGRGSSGADAKSQQDQKNGIKSSPVDGKSNSGKENQNYGKVIPPAKRESDNDWQNYWNPYTGNIKKNNTDSYIQSLASQYSKYNIQEKKVRPHYENFKIHQAINHKIYHNLQSPQLEKKKELQRLVTDTKQSFMNLTNYYEFQGSVLERLVRNSKSFPTRKCVLQIKQCNQNSKQQYVEILRLLKSQIIIEEKDSLKDSQIRIIDNIPSIKQKMTKLESLKQEQEKNYKVQQQGILNEEKLALVVMAKKWGLAVRGTIIDLNYQQLCNKIFEIVNKVLQNQYNEKNEQKHVQHPGCQVSMQNQVNIHFQQYIQNLGNIQVDEQLFQQLNSLVLDSFDCYINYGKEKGLQLNYSNQYEKFLLITLINYSVLYSCANQYNNSFPKFDCSGCSELGPFCLDSNTQFTYENLCKLQTIYSKVFLTRQDMQIEFQKQIDDTQQQVKEEIETCIKGEGNLRNRELMDLVQINSDISDLIESDAPVFYQLLIDALDENEKKISIIELESDEQKQQDLLKDLLNEKNRDKIKAFLI